MTKKRILGNLMLLTTAFFWGTAFVFQRSGMDHIEPLTFNAARMFLAFLALSIVVRVTEMLAEKKKLPETRNPQELAAFKKNTMIGGVFCGLMLTMGISFQQMGIVYTTAGKTGFITALYMVFVPIIGWIFLKKRINWLVGMSVVLATVGLYFLSIAGDFALTKGDTLILICAVFYALHILACDHFVNIADVLKLSRMQFLVCALLSLIVAFIFETPTIAKLIDAAIPILFCGLLSGGLGYTLQMIAQKHTEPTTASLILSLEAVFGVLGGWLILNEIMTSREIFGCIIVFVAITLVQIPLPEKQKG